MENLKKVSILKVKNTLYESVKEIFDNHGGLKTLLQGRKRAIIKINAVNSHPETYTNPAVLEAVIRNIQDQGISDIRVVENCTQGNFTRMVFSITEIGDVCRRTGAKAVFLDEGPTCELKLPGIEKTAGFNRWLTQELNSEKHKNEVFFLNLPKLKTHSMSVVTLGTKNLLGLMAQQDRMYDHNYNLHEMLASLGQLFPPDFTLIDGLKVVFHGHYPPAKLLSQCTESLNLLIGGPHMLAVDLVGARIMGYEAAEIKHLSLAKEKLGPCDLENIQIEGDISTFQTRYPYTFLPEFPADVEIYKGEEQCCPEGCYSNTMALLQLLYLDHNGKGGFNILMGKGFTKEVLEQIKPPLLLAGDCAIDEAKSYLEEKHGSGYIWETPACNDLCSTIKALSSLMKVKTTQMVPLNPVKSFYLLAIARLKGSRARVPI